MKTSIKNAGRNIRVLSVTDRDMVKSVSIAPGQSVEGDFVETKMLKAALDNGSLVRGKTADPKPTKPE